jgi:flavoprotein
MYLLPATQKEGQYLNSNELLYTKAFNYVTFADYMNVPIYIIAVDYDRYAIVKYCMFRNTKCKSVSFKYFTCFTNWLW